MSACIPAINKPNPTHGYALRVIDGRRQYEHTAAWESVNGPVPAGHVLDHICHDPATCPSPGAKCPHRSCRNPDHLTPVTRGENVGAARSARNVLATHCGQGHEFTPENTYTYPNGRRRCRTCHRAYVRAWKAGHR